MDMEVVMELEVRAALQFRWYVIVEMELEVVGTQSNLGGTFVTLPKFSFMIFSYNSADFLANLSILSDRSCLIKTNIIYS